MQSWRSSAATKQPQGLLMMEYEELDRGDSELPKATDDRPPVAPPDLDNAVEVHPIRFDKDYLDFRGDDRTVEDTPKASFAPVSVGTQLSPTGLEDVSEEDLENPVLEIAERELKREISKKAESTSQASSEEISTGKSKRPARK